MFVHQLLPAARGRLAIVTDQTSLNRVAQVLNVEHINLAVVCDPDGRMMGVITDSDVVRCIARCEQSHDRACQLNAVAAMTRDVLACRLDDDLRGLWAIMKTRGLRHIPVIDDSGKPAGVLYARDALSALLGESEFHEREIRDYVFGSEHG